MSYTYVVASTGGIEEPSFRSFTTEEAAQEYFQERADDLRPGEYGDRVDLLRVETTGEQTTTLVINFAEAATTED